AHERTTELEKSLHNWVLFRLRPSSRVDGNTSSLLLAIKVAKGCSSCIHAGNDFAWAMRVACSAVAVPKDAGNQSNAKAMTSNAPLGVSLRHFLNTHAIPASKALWSACSKA